MNQKKTTRAIDRRNFTTGALSLGAAGVAGGLFGKAPAFAQANSTLKLGILLPRSGLLAQAGQSCQRGADIAVPLFAEMGIKLELMNADTESNPDVARSRTEKLINDGAHAIIGAFDSGQTLSAAQVCEQKGVPLVINTAAAPQITEQGYKTVFRNFPTSVDIVKQGYALMKDLFAATGKTPTTAVFLYANDTFGQANKAATDALLPGLNMPFKLLDSISYDPKAQDLAVEVAKAKSLNPELVIVTTRANDAIMLVREMVKQRFEPMGVVSPGSPGLYDEQFYKVLGKFGDYCITNVPWVDSTKDISKKIKAAFIKQFPNDRYDGHSFNVGFMYEAILIAADAFKRAGTPEAKAMLEALRATNIADHTMIGAPIKFDAKGQNTGIGFAVVQNRNAGPAVVLPAVAADMPPVFPMPGWTARG